jgi:hypothetical protein
MRRSLIPFVLVACGKEPEREIEQWQAAEQDGDCDEETLYPEPYVGSQIVWNVDLGLDNEVLPDGYGAVVTTREDYEALLASFEIGIEPYTEIDFKTTQVAAVWLERCQIGIQTVELLRQADASYRYDVTLADFSEGCEASCSGLRQTLVMNAFPNDEPATVCRRIVNGCTP